MIFKKTDNFPVYDVPLKGLYWWIPGEKCGHYWKLQRMRVNPITDKMGREVERGGF